MHYCRPTPVLHTHKITRIMYYIIQNNLKVLHFLKKKNTNINKIYNNKKNWTHLSINLQGAISDCMPIVFGGFPQSVMACSM